MDIVIQDLRESYEKGTLEIAAVANDPITQFKVWLQGALDAKIKEPNAMTLATSDAQGRPSARVVLLKGVEEEGFVFYTNYESQKGQELLVNPYAALVFNWLDLEQQVRIKGKVEKLSAVASESYFQSRPKGSQIGAWASPQSQIIQDRSILEKNVERLHNKYAGQEKLPCPPHWGGFLVRAEEIEFWQGRSSRLHDRIRYRLQKDKTWVIERLAP
ncbi:MAG: pyridoxamine 5'-phosphate oxidase [Bacteroidota bacterium]